MRVAGVSTKSRVNPPTNRHAPVIRTRVAPHLMFFWLFNAVYFLPILFIYLSGYVDVGAADAIGLLDSRLVFEMTTIYAEGIIAYTVGSFVTEWLLKRFRVTSSSVAYPTLHLGSAERISVTLIAGLFICVKAAMIPLGVYHVYAADSGEMTGGIWSFSMVCSECLLLASILVLNSDSKWNVSGFVLLSVLNGVNLLHGTRIIFIVNIMAYVLYLYVNGRLTLKRILILGPLLFTGVVALAFFVFLSRSGSDLGEQLSIARALSPIIYESVFSQLSLGAVVNTPDIMNSTGSLPSFLVDIILFTAPRFLVPDKDALTYIHQFNALSPLGAFNGYAAGLIYFGVFWPLFYVVLGGIASWLYSKAKGSPYSWIFYSYFTSDVLFRFMRDGYLIPVKILGDMLVLLAALAIFKVIIRGIARKRTTVAGFKLPA